jgi:hypothetical protein
VTPFSLFEKTSHSETTMPPRVVGALEGHALGCRVLGLSRVSPFLTRVESKA